MDDIIARKRAQVKAKKSGKIVAPVEEEKEVNEDDESGKAPQDSHSPASFLIIDHHNGYNSRNPMLTSLYDTPLAIFVEFQEALSSDEEGDDNDMEGITFDEDDEDVAEDGFGAGRDEDAGLEDAEAEEAELEDASEEESGSEGSEEESESEEEEEEEESESEDDEEEETEFQKEVGTRNFTFVVPRGQRDNILRLNGD